MIENYIDSSEEILMDHLNLEIRELLGVIDFIIQAEKKDYFNYEPNKCSNKEYLFEQYKMVREAKEKLINIFKD